MSGESDEEEFKDARSRSSDSDESDGTPDQWNAPEMPQDFTHLNQDNNTTVDTGFVSSLSRVHSKEGNNPPPVPPKSFKQKRDAFEKPTEEKSDTEEEDQNQPFFRNKTTERGNNSENRMSVKDKAKMFEQSEESFRSKSVEHSQGPNPFMAVKRPPEYFANRQDEISTSKSAEMVVETNIDTGQLENSSHISEPFQEAVIQSKGNGEESQSINKPLGPTVDSEQHYRLQDEDVEKTLRGSPQLKHKEQQEHPEAEKLSSRQHHDQESHFISEIERPFPWSQQHTRTQQHPGPKSSHWGWPGTPPPQEGMYSPGRQFSQMQPQYQGVPEDPSGFPRPVYNPSNTGPREMQPISPEQPHEWNQRGPVPYPYGFYGFPHQPFPVPPEVVNPDIPVLGQVQRTPSKSQFTGQGQTEHSSHQTYGVPQKLKPEPEHGTPSKKTKNPVRQVPTGKGEIQGTQQKEGAESTSTSKKQDGKSGGLRRKLTQEDDSQEEQGSKADDKKSGPSQQGPEKCYICVSGIGKDTTTESVFNYLEIRAKLEIITAESMRDKEDHAVVVFEDKIDIEKLRESCRTKKMTSINLEFGEVDPPKLVIASSHDDKLTEDTFRNYLESKRKLSVQRVYTTEEGFISAKFKDNSEVEKILKDTNIKISGCEVIVSPMYYCDHGMCWDHNLHRVSIPAPFKLSVPDSHIKSFIIEITSVCDAKLKAHHGRLMQKDEMHIECTLDPKNKDTRQKVKTWEKDIRKAWEEFVKCCAHKKEIQINDAIKDSLLEYINKTKISHTSEELTVLFSDDSQRKFVFVGESKIVENFHNQISAKKIEIQEKLDRKNKITSKTMKNISPLHLALLKEVHVLDDLQSLADDLNIEADDTTGQVTLIGVPDDIRSAEIKIYEAKNDYELWQIDDLSMNKCKLLEKDVILQTIVENIRDNHLHVVIEVKPPVVKVCTNCQNKKKLVEKIIKDEIEEEKIVLDSTNQIVLTIDEWTDKKEEIQNDFSGTCIIDDSQGDSIVVTARSLLLDGIMVELNDFIVSHSIYTDTVVIQDDGVMKYLEKHCNSWKSILEFDQSKHSLKMEFRRNMVYLSGTKIGITMAKEGINDKIRRIGQPDMHSISKPGIDSLFDNKHKTSNILEQIEDDTETIILVDENLKCGAKPKQVYQHEQSEEDFVMDYAAQNFHRQNTGRKMHGKQFPQKGHKVPKTGPYVCKNKTKITLVLKQGLSKQQADVIVCSTNASLDLTGKAGSDLVKGAGQGLLLEIKIKYSDGIKHGDIAVLQGHSLNCQKVFLAALPSWKTGVEKTLQDSLNACLKNASGYKSIVLPAMGTGAFSYPRDKVAELMYTTVCEFDKTGSNLKDVRFLCFDDDTIQAFKDEEAHRLDPKGHHGLEKATGPNKKNNITVTVVKGDLGKMTTDVLVAAVPKDLNLESAAGAGLSLMKHVPNLQAEINNKYSNGIRMGGFAEIPVSSGGTCKAVYLTSIEPWNVEKSKKDEEMQIWKFVYKCLETMSKSKLHSIAIPAMGTSKIGYPPWRVAAMMYNIVDKFSDNNKRSTIKDMKLIVYPSDTNTVKAFEKEEVKRIPSARSGPKRIVNIYRTDVKEFMIGDDLKFSVEQGNILKKKCDAIVNSTNDDLDMSKGAVAQALKAQCDKKKLDEECTKKRENMKKHKITSTSGCGLPVHFIFHITYQSTSAQWKKMIGKAMKKAEDKKLKTLSLPALGTGGNATDPHLMGQTIVEGLKEYLEDNDLKTLKHVYLVIFQPDMVTSMLQGIGQASQRVPAAGPVGKFVVMHDDPVGTDTVKFLIYGERNTHSVKQMLMKAIESEYEKKEMHDSVIEGLTDNEQAAIHSVKKDLPIKIYIDKQASQIVLEGLKAHIIDALNKIHRWLSKFRHRRHCEVEAKIMNDQVQWFFKEIDQSGKQLLREYPRLINMHLENAHRGISGRSDVDFQEASGIKYIIDLNTMKEYPVNDPTDTVEVIRREKLKDAETFNLPSKWDDNNDQNLKVITLLNYSQEFMDVEKMFKTSVLNGHYKSQFNASTFKVTKIERIQNISLYQMYAAKRKLIKDQNQGSNVVVEQQLWHGTGSDAVPSIIMYGYNRSYCGKNGTWFGYGVYFANDASYSARNWVSPGGTTTSVSQIFLSNVLTGKYCKGDPNMRVLPQRSDGSMLNFDSGVDDVNKPLEYVIFNDTQAYPEYCISFVK
ncbi:protein mono-ADP-ribosyltransferase PARP14-like [Mytilus californianus]|uniref:protein mono-ADP-ribosyltransferase PARP14-like n=1 Tax=Mytilus californianus TaxID=6549 RepID=UPI00224639A2|nr:protein mono-ADP-ribosyltransferase PARP14-like [Mytilus californianus]